ncbi:MAG TPA: FG-GAP-like repeat-containing protein [Candidatus Saccharimonadales bacterium]|nr:FG-GAP-like repeat-containing protein [Candidatus Saccharimonadales bacterium]
MPCAPPCAEEVGGPPGDRAVRFRLPLRATRRLADQLVGHQACSAPRRRSLRGAFWNPAFPGLYSAGSSAPRRIWRQALTPSPAPPQRLLPVALAIFLTLAAGAAKPAGEAASGHDAAIEHNNIGIALLAQFKPADAEKEFDLALRADPAYVPALVNVGIAQLAEVRYDDAIASFQNALLADPSNVYAHYNLSLIYKIQGKAAEGIQHALSAVASDPRDADLQYNLGTLYQSTRDLDKAIKAFEAAIRLDPNLLPAYYAMGRAYIAKGDVERGKQFIEKHQELAAASNLPASSGGLKYGEQGRYSYAMEDPASHSLESAPLEPGKLTFVDVTSAAGIRFVHGGGESGGLGGDLKGGKDVDKLIRTRIAPFMGSGAAVADIDGDGAEDIVLLNTGGRQAGVFLNRGKMTFVSAPEIAKKIPAGEGMGIAAGDVDNDGDVDLLVTRYGGATLLLNDGKGGFTQAPLPPLPGTYFAAGGSLADVDHDGDLDLFVAGLLAPPNPEKDPLEFPEGFGGEQVHLIRNNGNGTFSDITSDARLTGVPHRTVGAIFLDYDNDRDIDFAVSRLGGGLALFTNNRDGTFSEVEKSGLPSQGNFLGICAGDYNNDGLMDLAATSWDSGLPRIFRNTGSGGYALDVNALANIPRSASGPLFGCAFADLDDDGLLDLIAVNGSSSGSAVLYLRNLGSHGFEDASGVAGLTTVPAHRGRGLALADLDDDGDLDLIISNNDAAPTLLRNDGGNTNHWVRVAARGLNSNRMGIGTKVEVKSGLLWEKTEIASGSGYLSSSSPRPLFGLGKLDRVDAIRLLWPGGVLQDELRLAADTTHPIEELDRKGTSCPILYAWDGARVAFVSDFLGGSALGYRLGPSTFNYPDTDEYVRIPPGLIEPRKGLYEIRMNNQLEETIYFDQAQLVAVDHPAGTEAYPDERLMPSPPGPSFRVFLLSNVRPPLAATDGAGRNLLPELAAEDRRYVEGFRLLPWKGYAEEHSLELDLGPLAATGSVLLLTGWIDYADSSSNLAASQAGDTLTVPYLEALDPATGQWVKAIDPIGFPAGLTKTMTVDLTGKLPAGARRVRIRTSMRIYWDQVRVGDLAAAQPVVSRLDPEFATLRYRGFPATVKPGGSGPPEYDYSKEEPYVTWMVHTGAYTRYGDVRDLLLHPDDMYVITRAGDEILIGFDSAALPPVPPGDQRTFLVFADGFGKDMDVNSARPDTVGPLPYHAMKEFPYGQDEGYPLSEAILRYLAEYNTRIVPLTVPPIGGGGEP